MIIIIIISIVIFFTTQTLLQYSTLRLLKLVGIPIPLLNKTTLQHWNCIKSNIGGLG